MIDVYTIPMNFECRPSDIKVDMVISYEIKEPHIIVEYSIVRLMGGIIDRCRMKRTVRKIFGNNIPKSDDIIMSCKPVAAKLVKKYSSMPFDAFESKIKLAKSKL